MKTKINFIAKLNIVLLCIMLTFLSGCTDYSSQKEDGRINVVTVIYPQYDFARGICGDLADVKMIMRPGAEVHGYEPSLSDIIAIEEADVFIYNGGESDEWIKRILKSVDTSDMISLSLMEAEGIKLYEEENAAKAHHHNSNDEHHHEDKAIRYDEHIWTSPKNARVMVNAIKDAIIKADSKNEAYYRANSAELIKEIDAIDAELSDALKNSKKDFIVVADRFPFLYLANDYGLRYMAAFSACSPESDAGPKVIAHMIEEMKETQSDTVFYIELSNQKMADAICEHTGAKKMELHSGQSITYDDFKNGIHYTDIMKNNVKNLKEALN